MTGIPWECVVGPTIACIISGAFTLFILACILVPRMIGIKVGRRSDMETSEALAVGAILVITLLVNLYTRYRGRGRTGNLLVLEKGEWEWED